MVALGAAALVSDLEQAVRSSSPERRVEMLHKITDLFLSDADRLNEQQIKIFDDVLVRLMERIEARVLARLSDQMADNSTAPREVVRQLAFNSEIEVASSVLARSTRLAERDLVTIASNAEQGHLLAICSRKLLNEAVTDALIRRSDSVVSNVLARNGGARFSEHGYATLIESAPPELRDKIEATVQSIVGEVKLAKYVDYTHAQNAVLALNRAGNLSDSAVNRFARNNNHKNVIASLALLSSTSIDGIESVGNNPRPDGLIVACKASRLSWSTTSIIVRNRKNCSPVSRVELEQGRAVFEETVCVCGRTDDAVLGGARHGEKTLRRRTSAVGRHGL
jgi:hypothetical protein